ncbi:MAG: hypothetical protein NZ551_08235, partial [Microscillaceae bacterium]|nr:hypothetical protein [Microscillaceae bacterium]MDW8461186.1 hypothetical protein [Cytophagales bacterium]
QKDFQFVMVLQIADKDYDFSDLKNTLGKHTQYIVDDTGEIAQQCGVYSTPQAVILNTKNQLYYRGNYNRARYCTDKKTNYAQMAMDSLLAQKPPPNFGLLATKAYGCELPQEQFEYENQ